MDKCGLPKSVFRVHREAGGLHPPTPPKHTHTLTGVFHLTINKNIIYNLLLYSILDSSYFTAPYTVFKELGIPGPTPIPVLGTVSPRTIFNVSFCLFGVVEVTF